MPWTLCTTQHSAQCAKELQSYWWQPFGACTSSSSKPNFDSFWAEYVADAEYAEPFDNYVDDYDEGNSDTQATIFALPMDSDGVAVMVEQIPQRPYLLGRGPDWAAIFVEDMEDLMGACERFWDDHYNTLYQACMQLLVTAETKVMLDLEKKGLSLTEFLKAALELMTQKVNAAGQHHHARKGKPINRTGPDPWEDLYLIWTKQQSKPFTTSCQSGSTSMHSRTKDDWGTLATTSAANSANQALQSEGKSNMAALKASDMSVKAAMQVDVDIATEAMKPTEDDSILEAVKPVVSEKFSWMWDARASTIEAWYQELCALHHAGDSIRMGVHLDGCVRDVSDGSCQFAPAWLRTAFSWTGRHVVGFCAHFI